MISLVTGSEGFVGPYLVSLLKAEGYTVFRTDLRGPSEQKDFYTLDVTDREKVFKVIEETKPDYIFHLAGFSSVKASFDHPELCKQINVEGTRNVLDAIAETTPKAKILVVSSAEVYGTPEKLPITEEHPISAKTPYGESRLLQEALCRESSDKKGLQVVITRSFNHTGPGQQDIFVIPSFARQITQIEKGKQDSIKVGNLDAIRDFSDVRDVVKAYLLLIEKGVSGELYNVCSGKGHSIKSLLDKMIAISSANIKIEHDPVRMRKIYIPELIGDNTKLKEATGWKPEIMIEQTLIDTIEYWRNKT